MLRSSYERVPEQLQKCSEAVILRICRSQTPISRIYTRGGQPLLDQVNEAKYFGITISDELDWSPHIDFITSKARNTLSFLRRNLRSCPQSLRELAYISLVRSQLDMQQRHGTPIRLAIPRRSSAYSAGPPDLYATTTVIIVM